MAFHSVQFCCKSCLHFYCHVCCESGMTDGIIVQISFQTVQNVAVETQNRGIHNIRIRLARSVYRMTDECLLVSDSNASSPTFMCHTNDQDSIQWTGSNPLGQTLNNPLGRNSPFCCHRTQSGKKLTLTRTLDPRGDVLTIIDPRAAAKKRVMTLVFMT